MMLEIVLLCVTPLILVRNRDRDCDRLLPLTGPLTELPRRTVARTQLKDCNIAGGHLEPHFEAPFFPGFTNRHLGPCLYSHMHLCCDSKCVFFSLSLPHVQAVQV